MPWYRNALQSLGAISLLAVALACGGKNNNTTSTAANQVTISGTVTYKRVPLAKDAQGVPTGAADKTADRGREGRGAAGVARMDFLEPYPHHG